MMRTQPNSFIEKMEQRGKEAAAKEKKMDQVYYLYLSIEEALVFRQCLIDLVRIGELSPWQEIVPDIDLITYCADNKVSGRKSKETGKVLSVVYLAFDTEEKWFKMWSVAMGVK